MDGNWPKAPENKRVYLGVAFLFMIVWLAARAYAVWPLIHSDPEHPRLSGADSYYHLRHAEAVMQNYPLLTRFDNMSYFPTTERGLNQGLYDILVATLSKMTLETVSPQQVLTWLAATLTGLSALIWAYFLGRKESAWCGLIFLVLIFFYPGPITQIANVGNGDHHGWELFLQTLLMFSLTWALRSGTPVRYSLVPSGLLLLIFLSWPGSPLHLFFAGLCLFAWAFVSHQPSERSALIKKGVIMGAMWLFVPLLIKQTAPDLIIWYQALKAFTAAGAALTVGYPLLILFAQKFPAKSRIFVAPLILVGSVFLLKLSPDLWAGFAEFITPRSSKISEQAVVTPASLFAWYGLTWLGLLIAPFLMWRRGRLQEYCVPLVYGIGISLFWMYSRDFNYYAPYPIAASAAYCLRRLPWRTWTPAVVVLVSSVSLLPIPHQARPWLTPKITRELFVNSNGVEQAGRFLAEVKEQSEDKNYGLLAPWDLGNVLAYTSKTGVAYSQTHSAELSGIFYADSPELAHQEMEKRGLRFVLVPTRNIEQKLGTDYTLIGRNPAELMKEAAKIEWNGNLIAVPAWNERFGHLFIVRLFDKMASNMGQFRLVYESPQKMVRAVKLSDDLKGFTFMSMAVTDEEATSLKQLFRLKNRVHPTSRGLLVNPRLSPDVRVFERVPGAVLTGKTNFQHGQVGAYLSVSSPYAESPYIIAWSLLSDNFGYFDLRLPYPTDGPLYDVEGSIVVNGPYRVECNGKVYEVKLTEEQIQSGERIPLESFPVFTPNTPPAPEK